VHILFSPQYHVAQALSSLLIRLRSKHKNTGTSMLLATITTTHTSMGTIIATLMTMIMHIRIRKSLWLETP